MSAKKKNKLLGSIIFSIFFLGFIGVMDYPFVAQLINDRFQAKVVNSYDKEMAKLQKSDVERMLEDAENYNKKLAQGTGVELRDIFTNRITNSAEYKSLLHLTEDGVMGILSIPKINLELPIYHGTGEYALENGTGHIEGSSLPIGGPSTHACISGHRGLPSKELFTSLDLMEIGDEFYIRVLGKTFTYEVVDIVEVLPENVDPLKIKQGEDLVTLITCTPYGINTHRLFVTGRRVKNDDEGLAEKERDKLSFVEWLRTWWWVFVTVLLLVIYIRMLVVYNRGKKKKKRNKKDII